MATVGEERAVPGLTPGDPCAAMAPFAQATKGVFGAAEVPGFRPITEGACRADYG